MTGESSNDTGPLVVVTGANGLVGGHVVRALLERGAHVRAVVRRAGTAPQDPRVEEHVGEFHDPEVAGRAVAGADAVVTTVHPMGADAETQRRVAVEGTPALARIAADAGVELLVHVSTAAVYDRVPGRGDVDEDTPLAGADAGDYAVTKRDTDAALAQVDGLTRVLVRPPAILGRAETSMWNVLWPAHLREEESARHVVPEKSFAWVHVDDLAALVADVATGRVPPSEDGSTGPAAGGCTPVNVAGAPATWRSYVEAVAAGTGIEPVWESGTEWTGRILTGRAERWGWAPKVDLETALAELTDDLRAADVS